MLLSCLAYSSTMKIDATCSFETSVDIQLTKPRYIPEERTLCNHRSENLKSQTFMIVVLFAGFEDSQRRLWRMPSSGTQRRVIRWLSTEVSEEYVASIFRVKQLLSRWFLAQLIFSTLKMEAICSSETSGDTQRTTRRYIPEDGILRCPLYL
jgi:hypothetical protein